MSMLGAQLEDLTGLDQQLQRTAAAIETSAGGATAVTTTVVTRVQDAAAEALTRIRGELDALRTAVEVAHGAGVQAVWTGVNAERFRAAAGDFRAAMQRAEATTEATYQDFATAIDRMGASLVAYERQLAAALGAARTSTESMAAAVRSQHAALDTAMNTGLALG